MDNKLKYNRYVKIPIDQKYSIYELINTVDDNMKIVVEHPQDEIIYMEYGFPGLKDVTFKIFVDGSIELTLEYS